MLKPIVIAALTCGPAIAAAQPVVPAPPAAQQPLQLKLTVNVGASVRTHDVSMFDHGCNRIEEKTDSYQDEIELCTRPAPQGVYIDVKWHTRNGSNEYRTSSGAVVARKGGKFEVGRIGGVRFVLQAV